MPIAKMVLLLERFEYAASRAQSLDALQREIAGGIAAELPYYNWIGFYMLDPSDKPILVLGPYVGSATSHVQISVAQGICGAAVAQGVSLVIDDVNADPRYLACSIETKSEIVVPIRVHEEIVGEIDVDSHQAAAFRPTDRQFLESCAAIIGSFIERQPTQR